MTRFCKRKIDPTSNPDSNYLTGRLLIGELMPNSILISWSTGGRYKRENSLYFIKKIICDLNNSIPFHSILNHSFFVKLFDMNIHCNLNYCCVVWCRNNNNFALYYGHIHIVMCEMLGLGVSVRPNLAPYKKTRFKIFHLASSFSFWAKQCGTKSPPAYLYFL
jgi:hypothetical protein